MPDKPINYEKIGLYVALGTLFFTLMLFLYQVKDDLGLAKERVARLEVKVDKIEEKLK